MSAQMSEQKPAQMSEPLPDTAALRRATVAVALPTAAVASLAWALLMPPFPEGYADRLAAIQEAGAGATGSAVLFAVSQLFMLVAFLGIGRLARRGSPRLATIGSAVGVVGCFGHAVWSGVSLLTLQMAADTDHRLVHAAVLERFESTPVMLFAAAGMLGTVLGFLLLGIALLRSRAVARWIPILLFCFLVLEFVGSALSDRAGYASGLCLVIAFGALSAAVWRSPDADWRLAEPAQALENGRQGVGAAA